MVYDEIASGGLVVSGSATIIQHLVGDGGAVAGSESVNTEFMMMSGSGGAVIGGDFTAKSTLSILNVSPFVLNPTPTDPRCGCLSTGTISKKSFIAMIEPTTKLRIILESMEEEDWNVASFNRRTMTACLELWTGRKVNVLSVVLPSLTSNRVGL